MAAYEPAIGNGHVRIPSQAQGERRKKERKKERKNIINFCLSFVCRDWKFGWIIY